MRPHARRGAVRFITARWGAKQEFVYCYCPRRGPMALRPTRLEGMMADIREARKALVTRVLEGGGEASREKRRLAFDDTETGEPLRTLIHKVARCAHDVTDDDVAAARKSGLSEDQIFELVVCAAIGQATRQHENALAALAAATGKDDHAPRDPR